MIDRKSFFIRLAAIGFIVGVFFVIAVRVVSASSFVTTDPKVAKQHTADACVLAAMATAMNYKSGGVNYTSAGLALAYKLKYYREDWSKDGSTSHEAQLLARDAGFNVQFGKMDNTNGKVEALKYLAWSKQYPVVFLAGYPEHAITVLSLIDNNTLEVADPFNAQISRISPDELYRELDSDKWYVAFR